MCVACACVCTYVCLREHIYLFDSDFIVLPIMLITTVSANVTVKLKSSHIPSTGNPLSLLST